jgi:hypothetical protein
MKYSRLTKEQFEALNKEFANFLASQSIDKHEWEQIKSSRPHVAEQELDVFSDLIWEGVLTKAEYLEHFSKHYIFLFHCSQIEMHSIIIKTTAPEADFLTREGLQWLGEYLFTEKVEIKTGTKLIAGERNEALFNLIREGAILSDGSLYKQIFDIMNS